MNDLWVFAGIFLAQVAALLLTIQHFARLKNEQLAKVWKCGVTYGRLVERFEQEQRKEHKDDWFQVFLQRDPNWWKGHRG